MKKVIIFSFVFVNTAIAVFSQNDKFNAAMSSTLDQMKAAKTAEEKMAVAAKFERIADAEKTQWLPYYYAATMKIGMGFEAKNDAKDKIADEASTLLDKADAIDKNNSEIWCARAMNCYLHMMVDPMNRWMKYGGEAKTDLDAAKKADPANPRPYVLEANSTHRTPEQFGGGCKAAKPIAEKAKKLLDDFKPASSLHPVWGAEILNPILDDCK